MSRRCRRDGGNETRCRSLPAPDPTRTAKRFVLAAFSFVGLMASGVGVVACSIGLADTGHPAMVVGLAGSVLGIAAAFVVMWTALRAER